MDIQEIKVNKFKKLMLITLLLFVTLVIALGLNNSVSAVTIKSISGTKTWNIASSDIDYNLANVLNTAMGLGTNIKNQVLPTNTDILKPGYRIGATGGNANTFNWKATIGCVFDNSGYCQMACIHPTTSLDTSESTTYVQKVLFISKDKLTLYYTEDLSKQNTLSETQLITGEYSDYFSKILKEAYEAKTSVTKAEHLREHLADDDFHKKIKKCNIKNWKLMTGNNFSTDCTLSNDEYNYYGVFIFVGTGYAGSQGRIIYNAYRETKQKPVKVNLTKTDMLGTKVPTTATFTIKCVENAKFSDGTTEKDISFISKDFTFKPTDSTKKSFKLKITETAAPNNYTGFTGTITVTVYYDAGGKVTGTTSTNTTYIPNTSNENVKIKNEYTPPVQLKFYKTDISGSENLAGARIGVEAGKNVASITKSTHLTSSDFKSNTSGYLGQITIEPTDRTQPFRIKIKELVAPGGFNLVAKGNPVTLEITYNKGGKATGIKLLDNTGCTRNFQIDTSEDISKIKIKDDTRKINNLIINKKDISGKDNVKDAKFKLYFNGIESVTINGYKYILSDVEIGKSKKINGLTISRPYDLVDKDRMYIEGIKTNASGNIKIDEIIAAKNIKNISFRIYEVEPAVGYDKLPDQLDLLIKYENNKWVVSENTNDNKLNGSYWNITEASNKTTILLKNDCKIEKLTILKTNSSNANKVAGAKFTITLSNVTSIGGRSEKPKSGKITLKDVATNSNGNIVLEDLLITDPSKNVTIQIEETFAPEGYKKIDGVITVTLKRSGNDYTIHSATKEKTVLDSEFKAGNVAITNHELALNINNIPTITLSGKVWKDAQTGDKIVQTPNGKYDKNEELLQGIKVYLYNKDGSYANEVRTTDKDGKYEFKDIIKTVDGYYVVFEYNGIKYNNTVEGNESKATENSGTRTTFNNRFKNISKGQSNDGTPLTYEYNTAEKISTLKANIDGTNPASKDKTFKMQANTAIYTETTKDINYGLVERYFDLSIGTDVESATVKINGKEQKYDYNQILNENGDLKLDSITQNISASNNIIYNLYLYTSDYNYRISDYKTGEGEGIQNTVNPNDNVNYAGNQGNELEASVTYKVILKNQSTHDAAVKEFVYYYDEIYEAPQVSGIDLNKVTMNIDEGNKKITFTDNGNELNVGGEDYRKEILITFKVKKDSNGNLELKENCTNIAEITKYSTTTGGLIDNDSAPDNANITRESGNLKLGQYEDDTDQAPGINITIKPPKERKITGTVFNDINTDSINNDNTPVNDVVVQLIEIKKINAKYYEYIWQETKSGTNKVKTTARNGYTEESYNNNVTESGQYEFTGFIPANYIIRFIYGDGRTYEINENVQKYNGQDYKSTYDNSYKKEWYSGNNVDNLSVARDNEARRLEVMAYSVDINQEMGEKLEAKTEEMLQNTWMAAETSKINAEIESSKFNNMNFGLMERPKTELTLEKHITALKITPSGVGVQPIVDAKANIENILKDTSITTEGLTDGLSTIKSTRDERGWWKVETDIEELAQGAKLEVEYTYVIKNESDDYLNGGLVEAYEDAVNKGDISKYSEHLIEMRKSVKSAMRSGAYSYSDSNAIGNQLGQYYYTGTAGNNERPVLSQVELFEEALNNQLSYNEAIKDQDFTKANTDKVEKTKYNTNGSDEKISISTVITNAKPSALLQKGGSDYSKKVALETTLSSSSSGTIGGSYPSYIAQIVKYSNAAGRRNDGAIPGNLSYVHSDDTEKTMTTDNEIDEFWGETITISKPTGEDKQFPVQIAIIVISSIAAIGVGIILIKKFAIKTK